MIVTFVSASSGKSIGRVNSILDAFASRTSERTWQSGFTEDGVGEVRKALSAIMSKTLSVACYVNKGRDKMKLLWIAGHKQNFDDQGCFSVGYRKAPDPAPTDSEKLLMDLVRQAGLLHDIGKSSDGFQEKLKVKKAEPIADPVRHEWISMHLLSKMKASKDFDSAWNSLQNAPAAFSNSRVFDSKVGLSDSLSVLEFLVGSHHKLPRFEDVVKDGKSQNHVRDVSNIKKWMGRPKFVKSLKKKFVELSSPSMLESCVADLMSKAGVVREEKTAFLRGCATLSRIGLMLTDHYVSSMKIGNADKSADLLANTSAPGVANQTLEYHLSKISSVGPRLMKDILRLKLPKLSSRVVNEIMSPSADARFAWQDESSSFLMKHSKNTPAFVLNVAGTGSGKTKMNVKAICSLRHGQPIRVTSAMNLRTLTLQTASAYEKLFDVQGEMSCVLGDALTKKMFEYDEKLRAGEVFDCDEEADDENGIDVVSSISDVDLEYDWLESLLTGKQELKKLILSPISVSTIDYIVDAGDMSKSSRHLMAMLRVASSDLILDEVDGYDPKATVAVCRLVFMSGLFGRNIVASSATLSLPIVENLVSVFALGVRIRELVFGLEKKGCSLFMIDNLQTPSVTPISCLATNESLKVLKAEVSNFYVEKMKVLSEKSAQNTYRLGKIFETGLTKEEWKTSVFDAVMELKSNNFFMFEEKRVSFGLVRVANIKTAVELAMFLSKQTFPNCKLNVCCYHSGLLKMHRFHIERNLDAFLDRKGDWQTRLSENEMFRESVKGDQQEVLNLVVATPVEEVGRDHDFDFAVIEVSSSQSIVQTSGRVNRHRMEEVSSPNVGILRFNYRRINGDWCVGKESFVYPGYETTVNGESTHKTKIGGDIEELFKWENGLLPINASLRFDTFKHKMPACDDAGIRDAVDSTMRTFMLGKQDQTMWCRANFYNTYRLRDVSAKTIYGIQETAPEIIKVMFVDGEEIWVGTDELEIIPCSDVAWLAPKDEELFGMLKECGLGKEAMTVEVLTYGNTTAKGLARHMSFGFFRK